MHDRGQNYKKTSIMTFRIPYSIDNYSTQSPKILDVYKIVTFRSFYSSMRGLF